ncbi:MAG: nucleotidyltransferase domain-containing protein [Nanoarchaeota archaeon]|nr:nucleotidyltransferase domain-containing protein [Nanoarchaeota archaeon]
MAEVFFNEPTKEHYLIEISRKAKIAHTSVKNHLETLKRQGVIKETAEKKGERDFPLYKADTENKEYTLYKKTDNFIRLKTSGLVGYLKDSLMPSVIIVFGSYARGEDTEDSDIDIFVMCKEEPLRLEKFEKLLNRKIQLHFKKDLKDYPPELKNNIINGTVLDGYLEVF